MKNHFNGSKVINEFVRLKSKMYSLSSYDVWELNKANGTYLKARHQEYVDVLFGKKVARHTMKRKQSALHNFDTYDLNKISFGCFDDKRFVLDDGINTLAYGHKDIGVVY